MSARQRLAYLAVAAVIAVAAFVLLAGGGGDTADEGAGSAPTPTASPAPDVSAATPEPTPTPPRRRAEPLLTAGREVTLRAREGETVAFRVRHPTDEELHVHGYDITRPLPAGRIVAVSFEATISGIFEIELEGSHQLLARLEVRP